jgi:hypothetical protein
MTPQLRLTFKVFGFLPILLCVAFVNYTVDPVHIFVSFESRIAKTLMAGKNVTNYTLSTEAERLLQKDYIQRTATAPDVIVLGSSRSMGLHGDLFKGRRFFNHSVSAGSMEDYMAIYDLYKSKKSLPKTVILTVDPWVFNKNNNLSDWKIWSDHYYHLLSEDHKQIKFRLAELVPEKAGELVSFSYFQQAASKARWDGLFKKPIDDSLFQETPDKFNEQQTLLSDGSKVMDRSSLDAPVTESLTNAANFLLKGDVNRYHTDFLQIDASLQQRFENFVALLKQDGVEVILFLPPYHPFVYQAFMANHFDICNQIENYLTWFAAFKGCAIYGSYNPFKLSLTEASFFDALHFRESAFKQIFNAK